MGFRPHALFLSLILKHSSRIIIFANNTSITKFYYEETVHIPSFYTTVPSWN